MLDQNDKGIERVRDSGLPRVPGLEGHSVRSAARADTQEERL